LVAVGIGITVLTGIVYGRLTQRWGPGPDLLAAAAHIASMPREIGDWQLLSEEPIDANVLEILSCAGHVNRNYVNRQTGQTISIAILVGPSGPISVHTPEICYSSREYTAMGPRTRKLLTDGDGRTHSFWSLSFRPNIESIDQLRVCYAWSEDAGWIAAESPRLEFAGRRLLRKLQIASVVSTVASDNTVDPCQDFLSALVRSDWNINH
jgi:hypothetical protein